MLLEHSCDTAWVSGLVVSLDISGCSVLDTFYLVDFFLYMGVPHGGAVLQKGSDKRSICCFAAGFRTEAEIPSEHPQAGISFLSNLVHMGRPGQVFTDFHSKVGLSGHSL